VAHAQVLAHLLWLGTGDVLQDGRRGGDDSILELAEYRDERIGKSQRERLSIFDLAEKRKRQHGDRAGRRRRRGAGDRYLLELTAERADVLGATLDVLLERAAHHPAD